MEETTSEQISGTPQEERPFKYWFFLVAFLVIVFIGTIVWWGWLRSGTSTGTEHLIPHVPYQGQYMGNEITTQTGAAAYTLLDYWGDERFSADEIANLFPEITTTEASSISSYLKALGDFFTQSGYEMQTLEPSLDKLKPLIEEDVPVIVSQNLALDAPKELKAKRILIGFSDNEGKLTFHDNIFGNNYQMSYTEYEQLNTIGAQALFVRPTDTLEGVLKGVDTSYAYPERLGIMDSPGLREIQLKWMWVGYLRSDASRNGVNHDDEVVKNLEEIVNHPSFKELHPAARIQMSIVLAIAYIKNTKEPEKAIPLLENVTIPIVGSYDLNEDFGEWARNQKVPYQAPWYSMPYAQLGTAYMEVEDFESAEAAFKKALEYEPQNSEYQQKLNEIQDRL